MKRVTASEARKNWFRLLDEVVAGEVVVVERGGRRIAIRTMPEEAYGDHVPDYSTCLRVAEGAERAEEWGWDWDGDGDLVPRDGDPE